jgi:hypothetical protein
MPQISLEYPLTLLSSVGEFPSLSVNSRGLFYQFIGFERGKKEQELKK